ncbi:MAG: hypothetical protein AAF990_02650 [Bacteroidota bacterium]
MKVQKIFSISVLFFCAVLLVGCQKDSMKVTETSNAVNNKLPSVFELIALKHKIMEADGFVFVKNQNAMLNTGEQVSDDGLYTASAEFRGSDGELKTFGALSIDDVDISKSKYSKRYKSSQEDQVQLKGAFGKTIGVRLKDNGNLRSDVFYSEMYNPAPVSLNSPTPSGKADAMTAIGINETFTWNVDAQNSNGVYIIVYFDLRNILNADLRGKGHKSVSKLIQTTDNGRYQLSSTDLNNIPDGAVLDVIVGRANYQEVTTPGQDDYVLFGYTLATGQFKLSR